MSYPLVSILVPLYNHARYIGRCLDSILEDPWPAKEIVIIDDGSRDDSSVLVEAWNREHSGKHTYGFSFISRENRGLTQTLNQLVSMAHGEFIAILASDDYLLPGGIGARVDYLQRHPGRKAVFGDCKVADMEERYLFSSGLCDYHRGRRDYLADDRFVSYELVFNWCVPGPVFMARRETYEQLGGYDESIAVEDRDFYLRLAARNLVGFLDRTVAVYRVRPKAPKKERSVAAEISFNEGMLAAARNNEERFQGLRRAFLYAEALILAGKLDQMRGNRSLKVFLSLKIGRILRSVLKRYYRLWSYMVLSSAAPSESHPCNRKGKTS